MATKAPLVVIVGPTASGKSSLAMSLAQQFDGEIVCADSRTVYRGMDIGTAKPSREDQRRVPHHLLDIVDPGQRFTVADFQSLARKAIDDIQKRNKLAILVGGTGLYIDSVIFNYKFNVDYDSIERNKLELMSLDSLYEYSKTHNIKLPINKLNKRHVVRNIERKNATTRSNKRPIAQSIIVGIATEKEKLYNRITQRAEHIFESGIVDEAKMLGEKYGWNSEAMTGNIYPILRKMIDSELTTQQAKTAFINTDRRLAKRQITWFKRNKYIHWTNQSNSYQYISEQISLAKTEQK